MTLALARVPLARLVRTPRALGFGALWALVAIVSAVVARRTTNGADHVMRGSFGYVVVPLVAFAIVGAALGGQGLKRGVRGVVTLGASPRLAALAATLVSVVVSAALCGLLAIVVCGIAHGAADPPLARDLFASAWVSALGGAAYAAFFSCGSAIGKGALRGGFLAIDWIFGSGAGVASLVVPRGHVTALLGGALAADLPARASSVILLLQIALYTALAAILTKR
ncbi:MAG TPA: hypothetical protein VIF62_25445 [Labilithrix sp.]